LDANYTLARATEEAEQEDYIPLAPDFTLISGLSVIHPEVVSKWRGDSMFEG